MKITYLELENFIGIYYGLNRTKISIDFTKQTNPLILMAGGNGSGKSTIISTLHPYSSTMDDRTDIILENTDGYKEIHYLKGEDTYIIKHHYLNKRKNKLIKSYISKNGVELNENGTVRSFEEIVEQELDVTPSFFILSRIGSNVKNFIGLKPAERKSYMSKFLPDITEYLHYYKIVNDKHLYINKKIKAILAELEKLDDEDNVSSMVAKYTKEVKAFTKRLDTLKAEYNKEQGILSTMDNEQVTEKYTMALSKLDTIGNNLSILNEKYEEYKEDLELEVDLQDIEKDEYTTILEDNIAKKNELSVKLAKYNTLLDSNNQSLETYKLSLSKAKRELEDYQGEDTIEDLRELLKEYIVKLSEVQKEYKSIPKEYRDITVEDSIIDELSNYIKYIESSEVFSMEQTLYDSIATKYLKIDIQDLKDTLLKYKESSAKTTKLYNSKNTEYINLSAKLHYKDILKQRPSACSIDSCSFIKEAIKYDSIDEDLANIDNEKKVLKDKIDTITNKISNLELIIDYRVKTIAIVKEIERYPHRDLLYKLFPKYFFSEQQLFSYIPIDKIPNITILDYARKASHLYMDTTRYTALKDEVSTKIELLESKDLIIKKTEKDIKTYTNKVNKLSNLISANTEIRNEIIKKLNKLNGDIATYTELVKLIDGYEKGLSIQDKYTTIKNTIDTQYKQIIDMKQALSEKENIIGEVKDSIDNLTETLDEYKYKLNRIRDFKNDLEALRTRYEQIEYIRKALSPTKGIPLLFVDIYLKRTKLIANKLLNMAYEGKFYIEDFELTENDFYIKVVKDGMNHIKDVTLTSQGEMALISLAVSFAMIQQAEKIYNVILIDEMDKELDSENRRYFVDILNKQLDSMGIEQSFIISHNREFDSSSLDLMLYTDHDLDIESSEYMKNKSILFSVG